MRILRNRLPWRNVEWAPEEKRREDPKKDDGWRKLAYDSSWIDKRELQR
jgi:hypothetical protein